MKKKQVKLILIMYFSSPSVPKILHNQQKYVDEASYIFVVVVVVRALRPMYIFHLNTSRLGLATFSMPSSHMCLVATIPDCAGLEGAWWEPGGRALCPYL